MKTNHFYRRFRAANFRANYDIAHRAVVPDPTTFSRRGDCHENMLM